MFFGRQDDIIAFVKKVARLIARKNSHFAARPPGVKRCCGRITRSYAMSREQGEGSRERGEG